MSDYNYETQRTKNVFDIFSCSISSFLILNFLSMKYRLIFFKITFIEFSTFSFQIELTLYQIISNIFIRKMINLPLYCLSCSYFMNRYRFQLKLFLETRNQISRVIRKSCHSTFQFVLSLMSTFNYKI